MRLLPSRPARVCQQHLSLSLLPPVRLTLVSGSGRERGRAVQHWLPLICDG